MDASSTAVFRDRREAGRRLAGELERLRHEAPVVLALPRGGVPVGEEVAQALAAPFDILAVHRVGPPGGWLGAVAVGGVAVVDHDRAQARGVRAEQLGALRGAAALAAESAARRFRDGRPRRDVVGRTVLLVDDGVGAGDSALAAARAVRRRGAARIVLAVPVAGPAALARLAREVDEVVCLEVAAAERWYEHGDTVPDAEIAATLARTARERSDVPEAARGAIVIAGAEGAVQRRLDAIGFATFAAGSEPRAAAISAAIGRLLALPAAARLPIGCFALGPSVEEVLAAAAATPAVRAVVVAGGRPHCASAPVAAPTLIVLGGEDRDALRLARAACEHDIAVVPGASHGFSEPGALEQVADLAASWFAAHL